MKKTIVGITVVGKDKEGVVAQFTNFVFQNSGNVEKVNQNVIKGLFGMYLEVSFTSKINFKQLNSGLQKLGKKLRMEVSTHSETNTEKSIAIFVTKEEHCLKEILSARRAIKARFPSLLVLKERLHHLLKRQKSHLLLLKIEAKRRLKRNYLKFVKNIRLI